MTTARFRVGLGGCAEGSARTIAYYEESNGDFLAVDTATNRYYRENFGQDHFEGRATAIAGLVGSVCTTGIPRHQLGDAKLLFQPGLGSGH